MGRDEFWLTRKSDGRHVAATTPQPEGAERQRKGLFVLNGLALESEILHAPSHGLGEVQRVSASIYLIHIIKGD